MLWLFTAIKNTPSFSPPIHSAGFVLYIHYCRRDKPKFSIFNPICPTRSNSQTCPMYTPNVSERVWKVKSPGSEPPQHQVYHGDINHGFAAFWQHFIVLAQAAIFAQPAKRSFDNPTPPKVSLHGHPSSPRGSILRSCPFYRTKSTFSWLFIHALNPSSAVRGENRLFGCSFDFT